MRFKLFNPDKELKKINRKYTKKQLIMVLLVVVVMVTIGTSYAIFSIQPEYHIFLKSQVGEFSTSDIKLSVLVNGEKVNEFPNKGSGYGFEKIECKNGSTGTWSNSEWKLNMDFSQADSCDIYFSDSRPTIDNVDLHNVAGNIVGFDSNSNPVYALIVLNVAKSQIESGDSYEFHYEQTNGTETVCEDDSGACVILLDDINNPNVTLRIKSDYYGFSEPYKISPDIHVLDVSELVNSFTQPIVQNDPISFATRPTGETIVIPGRAVYSVKWYAPSQSDPYNLYINFEADDFSGRVPYHSGGYKKTAYNTSSPINIVVRSSATLMAETIPLPLPSNSRIVTTNLRLIDFDPVTVDIT